ncbi:MAG: cache domain-containing protein, partial [Oscillospiraceae bacterium]
INDMSQMIIDVVSTNDYMDSAYIIYPKRNLIITSYGVFSMDLFWDQGWIPEIKEKTEKIICLGKREIRRDLMSDTKYSVVTMVGKLPFYRKYTDGFVVINIKESFIADKLRSAQYGNGRIFIENEDGDLISSSENMGVEEYRENYGSGDQNGKGKFATVDSKLMIVSVSVSELNGWRYIAYTPIDHFLQNFLFSTMMILLFVLSVIGISFVLAGHFSKKVYHPIERLLRSTNNSGFSVQEIDGEFPEFKQINHNVNTILKEKDKLQKQIQRVLPSVEEKFFSELLAGQILDENYIKEYEAFLQLENNTCKRYTVAVLRVDDDEKGSAKLPNEKGIIYSLGLKNQVENHARALGLFCSSVEQNLCTIAFVLGFPNTEEMRGQTVALGEGALCYAREKLGITVTVGIGHSVLDLLSIQMSANQATEALEQSFLYGTNQLLFFRSIEKDSFGGYMNPLTFEKVLTNAIKTGNREEIIGIMGDIKKLICKNPVDIRLIRQFYLNILNMLFIIEHE